MTLELHPLMQKLDERCTTMAEFEELQESSYQLSLETEFKENGIKRKMFDDLKVIRRLLRFTFSRSDLIIKETYVK